MGIAVTRTGVWTMRRQNVLLSIWLMLPLAIIGLLVWAIAISLAHPPQKLPPVGAGAGDTGGANGFGQALAGRPTTTHHGVTTEDGPADESGGTPVPAASPDQPEATGSTVQPESLPQGFVLIVEDKSGKAKPDSPIFVAGSFNNWNPGDPAFKLEPQSDMRWRIVMQPSADGKPIEFKFTRGTWELEELRSDMSKPANRTLEKVDVSKLGAGEQPKIEIAIAHWGDERPEYAVQKSIDPYRSIPVKGEVRRLEVRGGAGAANSLSRELLVWLPPGYNDSANADQKYPVLYLHDGQNIFEKLPTVPAEWMADETATTLIERKLMQAVIIVGVPHSGAGRIEEYLPVNAIDGVTPRGEEHVQWLTSEVMPRIERAFRIKSGPEFTGVGGSSLGAAISLYAATTRPETFGIVLAESLPLRSGNASAWDAYLDGVKTWPRRIYLGMGGCETGKGEARAASNKGYVDAVRALEQRFVAAGLGADRRLLLIDEDATHTEEAWAARLPSALRFLFPLPVEEK